MTDTNLETNLPNEKHNGKLQFKKNLCPNCTHKLASNEILTAFT
jgi:hypothetical protein